MQRRLFPRVAGLLLAGAAMFAVACQDDANPLIPQTPIAVATTSGAAAGDSSSSQPGTPPKSPTPPTTSDTAGSHPTTPTTSNGPVASVRVTPAQIVVFAGNWVAVIATPLDANGAIVRGKVVHWTTSDPTIVAVVNDTGSMQAKAVGTATLTATVDGKSGTASVTVTAAVPAPAPAPSSPAATSFNLTVSVVGALAGSDTTASTPVAGAIVTLTRISSASGDTLTAVTTPAGSATTDANGAVQFKGLPGGGYDVTVTPPSGSAYAGTTTGFGPPHGDLVLGVRLQPKR